MKIYSGYIKEKKELLSTSSGGVATILSKAIVREGGFVFGVRYTIDYLNAEYCCVDNESGLEQLKGSKYTTSKKGNIYQILAEKLKTGRKVLYIGLGCDVAAAINYCKIHDLDTSNLYTIDILCHGPAVNGVHELFVKELEEKYHSKLQSFSIRYKKDGWTPFYVNASFKNGKSYIHPFDKTDYGVAFRTVAKPSCTHCAYKGDNHKGDICIGDYWGVNHDNPVWNPGGVSIIIVQTERGQQLIDMLDNSFYLHKEDDATSVLKHNRMYYNSRLQTPYYDKFVTDMNEKGLHYAVSRLPNGKNRIFRRIVRKMRTLVKQ